MEKMYIISVYKHNVDKMILALFLLNVVILIFLKIGLFLQLSVFIFILYFILIGNLLLGNRNDCLDDFMILVIVSAFLGISVFTLLNFVFLHFKDLRLIRLLNSLFFIIITILYFKKGKLLLQIFYKKSLLDKNFILLIFLLSFLITFCTNYGFKNSSDPRSTGRSRHLPSNDKSTIIPDWGDWGWNEDKSMHLIYATYYVHKEKFPPKVLSHKEVQIFLISINYLIADANPRTITAIFKIISIYFWFSIIYMCCYIGKKVYNLDSFGLLMLTVSVGFLSSVNYPLSDISKSSYTWLLGSASMGMYHNVTQLFSVAVGLSGVICYLHSIKFGNKIFWVGSFLISSSFFFKPSFFTTVTPLIFILIPFYSQRIDKDKIFGYFILLLIPIFWQIYPIIFHIQKTSLNLTVKPMALFVRRVEQFNKFPTENKYLLISFCLIFSYMIFLPIFIDLMIKIRLHTLKYIAQNIFLIIRRNIITIYFILVFISGFLPCFFLVESNVRMYHGNLAWGRQAGYLLLIPLLVNSIVTIENKIIKKVAFVIWGLHIWGGILHLLLFTMKGQL